MSNKERGSKLRGLPFYIHDKREPVVYIFNAEELSIISQNEFSLKGGSGSEIPFYSTFEFREMLKYPAELQEVEHEIELVLKFESKEGVKSKLKLPNYESGEYQLNDVIITHIAVQPSCCCGKVDVVEAKGYYSCISNEPIYNIPECYQPTIVLPSESTVPECETRCIGEIWRQIPKPCT